MHIGEGSGRGLSQIFCQQSRVGSGQRFAGSGRVQEKWPVDNSGLRSSANIITMSMFCLFPHVFIIYCIISKINI